VELALTIAGMSKAERTAKAKAALDKVGLSDQYRKRPNQMSGGQMQRVAIARALVNDPEIVLADEPTGALDSVTSRQILDLLREVAKDRLVIMVTHNGDLANEYSNRIVRLTDGLVTEDTRPYDSTAKAPAKQTKKQEAAEALEVQETERKRRAKMSLLTAFRLSLQNLLSKRRRSIMVSIAGSIGIIGVALVLSFSFGIQGYITNMQKDMLSGNPITIERTAIDLGAMMRGGGEGMNAGLAREILAGEVNIQHAVAQLYRQMGGMENMFVQNDICPDYLDFLENIPQNQLAALLFNHGLDLSNNIYTQFRDNDLCDNPDCDRKKGPSDCPDCTINERDISLSAIMNIYGALLQSVPRFKDYAHLISGVAPSFSQLPKNNDDFEYILSQYDLLHGEMPKGKNDILIVVSSNKRVTDMMLAQLGYFSQQEFLNVVLRITEEDYEDDPLYCVDNLLHSETRQRIDYDELMNAQSFTWFPNDDIFTPNLTPNSVEVTPPLPSFPPESVLITFDNHFQYSPHAPTASDNGVPLNVVGILQPKPNTSFGMLETGFYYTTEFAEYVVEQNRTSLLIEEFLKELNDNRFQSSVAFYPKGSVLPAQLAQLLQQDLPAGLFEELGPPVAPPNSIAANFDIKLANGLVFDIDYVFKGEEETTKAAVGSMSMMQSMMGFFGGMFGGGGGGSSTLPQMEVKSSGSIDLQGMGGNSVNIDGRQVHIPISIAIYPINLEQKDAVLAHLDLWNGDEDVEITRPDGTKSIIPAFLRNEAGEYVDEDGEVVTAANRVRNRERIVYSDPLSMVFRLMSQLVNLVTIALVAFTSLALVVSSVMIGIITYVSVVERVKEIGVIRSLGGRKRDVSNLFTAETFILGFAAGVIGVTFTYILSWTVSALIYHFEGIPDIAFLPFWVALIMVGLSVGLTLISGMLPSRSAARKDPVVALRTE
jgi:putative ABC transport system permease protein